jgi:hypothetical protein
VPDASVRDSIPAAPATPPVQAPSTHTEPKSFTVWTSGPADAAPDPRRDEP